MSDMQGCSYMYHKCFCLVVLKMTTPNKGYYNLGFCTLRRTNIQIKLAPLRAHPLSFRNPKGVGGQCQRPRKFQRGRGLDDKNHFPRGKFRTQYKNCYLLIWYIILEDINKFNYIIYDRFFFFFI